MRWRRWPQHRLGRVDHRVRAGPLRVGGLLAAAVVLPAAVWFTNDNLLLRIVTTALGLLAIYKHKGNIQRLIRGTESHVSFKNKGNTT